MFDITPGKRISRKAGHAHNLRSRTLQEHQINLEDYMFVDVVDFESDALRNQILLIPNATKRRNILKK